VPRRIRYDNLKPAVTRVLRGRDRLEAARFVALRSHYGFDSFFCIPGVEGAHEKGGVEGEVGRFRRRHLVPVPKVQNLTELNELVARADDRDDSRHLFGRKVTVAEHAREELAFLLPLPCRVDQRSRICVRQRFYSTPVHFVGRRVEVRLSATFIDIYYAGTLVARHERLMAKGAESLTLDHYLELAREEAWGAAGRDRPRPSTGVRRVHFRVREVLDRGPPPSR
jgi:hypothetical protein